MIRGVPQHLRNNWEVAALFLWTAGLTAFLSHREAPPPEASASYLPELQECRAIVSQCEVQALQIDEQIKAILNVTKEDICD